MTVVTNVLIGLLALAFLGPPLLLIAAVLVGAVVRAVRAALARLRTADDDDPYDDSDKHRCPICYDLAADEANGIIRTDFELWESEWTP